jgi:hypothetical protein
LTALSGLAFVWKYGMLAIRRCCDTA